MLNDIILFVYIHVYSEDDDGIKAYIRGIRKNAEKSGFDVRLCELSRELSTDDVKKIMEENESMKKQISIAENKAKLIGLGYSEELASSTAEAMFKGDMQTVLANQKTLLDEREKAIRAGMIDDTPKPPAGDKGGKSMTLAQLRKMSVKDRYDYSQAHPEEYASLYSEGKE